MLQNIIEVLICGMGASALAGGIGYYLSTNGESSVTTLQYHNTNVTVPYYSPNSKKWWFAKNDDFWTQRSSNVGVPEMMIR